MKRSDIRAMHRDEIELNYRFYSGWNDPRSHIIASELRAELERRG